MRRVAIVILGSLVGTSLAVNTTTVIQYGPFCACVALKSLSNSSYGPEADVLRQNLAIDLADRMLCDSWTDYPPGYEIKVFADRFGHPTTNLSEAIGLLSPEIYAFCGPEKVKVAFSFIDFTSSTAGLLLPWLAIFAQLGRQTGSRRGDILSILISIGSPAFISSSLFIGVLYQRAVHKRIARLRHYLVSGPSGTLFVHLADRCKAAQMILQLFLQAPVRLSTRPGWLSSLITAMENHGWWANAANDIEARQKRVDAVFIAQSVAAVAAWLLAIVGDFSSLPGQMASASSSEWQICMGSLWLWIFAATYGPIAVKTLYKARIMDGILASPGGTRNDGRVYSVFDREIRSEHRKQMAIEQRSGLNPTHQRRRRSALEFDINKDDEKVYKALQIPTLWGYTIEAYGEGEGPINFSGKFFTAWWASQSILEGLETTGRRLKENKVPDFEHIADNKDSTNSDQYGVDFRTDVFDVKGPEEVKFMDVEMEKIAETTISIDPIVSRSRTWDSNLAPAENFRGTSKALDRYTGIDVAKLTAYPEWNEIGWQQWTQFGIANLFGLALQWGTGFPAIWVMYFSPPIGLGCDSGGLLIYGVLGTLSWFLQTSSVLLSHGVMLQYQRQLKRSPWINFSKSHYRRSIFHSILCFAAVFTRLIGKVFAVINGLWILVWSLMTYTNVMETPYCTTAYFSLHKYGWMRLWNFDPHQFVNTKILELGCLVFGSVVGYCACVLIFFMTSDNKTRKFRCWISTMSLVGFVVIVTVLTDQGVKGIRNLS